MNRSPVQVRDASLDDGPVLAVLWEANLRHAGLAEQISDVETVIARVATQSDERLVVAEYDGQVAGAVYLRLSTMSPINLEPVLQVAHPHVLPAFRRRGVGHALMESAVAFAEERGVAHVGTASASSSRDANRFMARLSFGPQAVLRVATTQGVRARLTAARPVIGRAPGRAIHGPKLGQVLAVRRSMRRAQSPTG